MRSSGSRSSATTRPGSGWGFGSTVVRKLSRMSETERRDTLRQIVEPMARDVAGNFDPRVYGSRCG